MIYYIGGGVKSQNGKRYLTAETPPANEDSTVVPTTAWVQDKIDGVESAVSGGMFPTISQAVDTGYPGFNSYAPSGGTWWCFSSISSHYHNEAFAGGSLIDDGLGGARVLCIKIA